MSAKLRSAGYLSALSVLGLFATGCDQPSPKCSIARGQFAARYTLVSGTGECATLVGDTLTADVYYEPISEDNQRPNLERPYVSITSDTLAGIYYHAAGRALANPEDKHYALGKFEKQEPSGDFCVLPVLLPARVRLPALDPVEDMCNPAPGEPAIDVSYTWSNVKVYVTPDAYGTQLAADLTYTKDGCTAQYRMIAVYPVVACGVDTTVADPAPATDPDAGAADAGIAQGMDAAADMDAAEPENDGSAEDPASDGACPPAEPEPGAQVPDDSLCASSPGSGINPDFALACDPTLLLCVLKSEPPSLK
jgi:hypothetical protein